MLNPSALNNYIGSFFGYGRWSAPIWFVGIEEAGGRTEREIEQRLAVWAVRGKKELEDAPTFYPKSGNAAWHGGNATLQPTWTQLIRMLLIAQGKPDSPSAILDYQRNRLGTADGETCLLELFSLPSPNLATWNYADWSELPWLQSRNAYEQKVLSQRITLLHQRIDHYQPRVVIFYGDGQLKHWRRIMGNGNYPRPIPNRLISHAYDNIKFFVTKHPTNPELQFSCDDYFRDIGCYFRTNCGARFLPRK
jgi:hypothetical protein